MPAVATAGGVPTRLGKYEILTPLATGGMARIYIARTTGIGSFERHVVLKLITPERANDHTAVQMFLDEARLAASLNHQNVAQVFEVGEDVGIHYLAMEYVHGQDLRALLAKAGSQGTRVPLELSLTVVAGAAAGLNHAHERRGPDGAPLGIVHRDVSPSNIMIGYDGSVKLLDFGIAKAHARSVETQSGIIKGKFAYMAPEQCRGRDVDRRSDVFSLGIILYEITTQHRCFRADSDFDTMHRIVTGDVVRPTRLIQGYPQALEAIVMKALAVDANQRYQSAGLLLEAIEQFSVSARMSLSTMALGRFMRDMFGETPEPWLNQAGRASQPLPQPKESTISNTNSQSAPQQARAVALSDSNMPRTILDLPRGGGDDEPEDPHMAEWNAKSYPQGVPAYASAATLPPANDLRSNPRIVAASAAPPPAAPAAAPMQQFPASPGSGTGPSHSNAQALPSTRHGYAGAQQSDLSYPRYEPPADSSELVRVKPDRRPLFVGLAVVVVGVAVLLAMTIGGSGNHVETGGDGTASAVVPPETTPDTTPIVDPTPTVPADAAPVEEPQDESISIKLVSDPPGADVLLAGRSIGTTPLDTKIPKGTGKQFLRVHKAKYEDVDIPLDLSGDIEKTVALKPIEDKDDLQRKQDEAKKAEELRKQQERERKAEERRLQQERERKAEEAREKRAEAARLTAQKKRQAEEAAAKKAEEARKAQEAARPKVAKCQDPGRFNELDLSCAGQVGALKDGLCPPCPMQK